MNVRDHPNYQRPAFTLEEAESHAITHQTVAAFRFLKAIDVREAIAKNILTDTEDASDFTHDQALHAIEAIRVLLGAK